MYGVERTRYKCTIQALYSQTNDPTAPNRVHAYQEVISSIALLVPLFLLS